MNGMVYERYTAQPAYSLAKCFSA